MGVRENTLRKLRGNDGKFRLNRKAVSPVIAVLLMIAIAVAAAILVYVWSMGLIGTLQTGGGQQVREQVELDAYDWKTTAGTLNLYLRNVGSTDVSVAAVYVEGVQDWTGASVISIHSLITLGVSTGTSLTSGAAYTIKVVTVTGAVFSFACVYGRGA
jgi:flagellin-like protein